MNTSRALINVPKQILLRQLPAQAAAVRCMSDWVPQEKETHTGQVNLISNVTLTFLSR